MIIKKIRHILQKFYASSDAATRTEELTQKVLEELVFARISNTSRFQDPLRLLRYGYRVYSQNQEDGMITEIFRRIGVSSKRFVEIGVETGLECNSAFLLLQGWTGVWLEASSENAASARRNFAHYPVDIVEGYVTVECVDEIISRVSGGDELDLLSIDIDTLDYWLWKAIRSVSPRLVVIEYNATFPPHVSQTVAYNPDMRWDGSNFSGASLGALEKLGRTKGYTLVGCSLAGVNAFFVRNDLVGDKFCPPFTAENHYEPPRYYLHGPSGHRSGMGPWVEI